MSDHGQGKGLQLGEPSSQINIGWKASLSPSVLAGKVIMGSKLKEKSGRWTTAKDAPQPKGLTLIPENTEGGKKKKNVNM
jgi:hypothetical protein